MKEILKGFIKIFISFIIVTYLLFVLDIDKIIRTILDINIYYILIAFFMLFISLLLMVLKWGTILNKYINCKIKKLFFIYWASDFINLVSLGAIGSEVYKMISFEKKKVALLISLFDRFMSFVWFIFLAIAVFISYLLIKNNVYLLFLLSLLIYSMLTTLLLMVYPLKDKYVGFIKYPKIVRFIKNVHVSKKELFYHSLFSLLIIFNTAMIYKTLFYSIDIDMGLVYLLIFIPILKIAVTLPISFEGIGVREFMFVEFAKRISINLESALVCSFLVFITGLSYRLTGMIPFLILRGKN